ncbi:MAG: fibronectin type III domain-containing protein [[Eubacterium] siraeum]
MDKKYLDMVTLTPDEVKALKVDRNTDAVPDKYFVYDMTEEPGTSSEKHIHSFTSTVVKPTETAQGYTLHTCTKCGYSYKDNYTPALKPTKLTGVKVKTQGTASLTLAWDKNANAKGYIIEQYKGGKWTQIAKTSSNTAVTYTVNGLAADTTYTFRIKAYAISGESEIYSDYVRIAGKTRIANVASFKGSAVSASAVKLDWSKNDKATGYVIEQYKGGKWTAIATTKNNTTLTFTVKGLAKGTAYSFRIKSFRKTGSTTDFSEYTAIKAATLLDSVSDFKVASVTGSWITLEWAKNDKATGYSIEQYKGGKWTVIATTKNNATLKFTVKGLKNDTTYSFRIRAYKTAGGVTVYSDYVRIAGKTRIPNVAKFTGSAVSASAVKLDWSKNDKATGYVIEQCKGGKWTAIATTKNNTTLTFTVKGLAKGTTYSFRIKSFRKTGSTTEFSEYASVKAATDK